MQQQSLQSDSLETILTTTQDTMQQLLQILLNETAALEKNNIDKFTAITQKKIVLTEEIEKSEQMRVQYLIKNSLNPNEPSQCIQGDKLNTLWNKIKDLSTQAQRQNQVNGLVINGNRRQVQTKIDILSANPPSSELVYSSSGENIKQRNSNTIARA